MPGNAAPGGAVLRGLGIYPWASLGMAWRMTPTVNYVM